MLTNSAVPGACRPAAPAPDTAQEAAAQTRVAELERRFGDPGDPANPVGTQRLLAADEAA